jgi:tRNA(Ile)-lysidine synthase
LYQWLKQFGFTAWNDIYDLVHTQSGKQVISGDFVLLKDRDFLILYRKEIPKTNSFLINRENNQVNIPLKLSICNVSDISVLNRNCIFVDEDQLQFPLTLRRCMVGDYFYPFGMNGKKKLISKYLKDEKISLKDKADIWVLCSENKIVWLVNHRLDERFKVMESTKSIIKITIE